MRVFVIGAAGGVGRRLSVLLAARGDAVTGMHRAPDQAAAVAASGAVPVAGDLIADTAEALAGRMAGHDAVVFSAGAHGTGMDRTTLIDGEGVVKAAAAAARAGVRRFVLVSAFPEAGRGSEPREGFEHYMRVKKEADVHLSRTDLDWVIVRPGHLGDGPGDGRVTAGPAVPYGDVPRDDVAAFIDAVLHRDDLGRVVVELVDGPTPVAEAVASLVTTLAMPRGPAGIHSTSGPAIK
ncbi:MAG: NAD(P)H-binding protein [Thermoleophilia bacterium]